MIATLSARPPEPESSTAQQGANPLRRDGWVRCPRCGTEGEAWEWALKRSPAYDAYTVPVFRCRARDCGHYFALTP